MAWIRTIDESEAEGRLAELYGRLTEPWGGVDNILKIHSLKAPLEAGDRAMLDHSVRLTREPWAVGAEDVAALRGAGFEDAAILDICQVAAYFAFVNRLADGLSVDLEPHLSK